MIPAAFEYVRVDSVQAAVDRLTSADGEAAILAGGQGLVNDLKARSRTPDLVVDIGRVDGLDDRTSTADGGLRVGALVTHRELRNTPMVDDRVPGLADAVDVLGDRQVRSRGTLVGNLVECAPGADPPAVAIVRDAEFDIVGPDGSRRDRVADLINDEDGLGPGEVVTAVRFDGEMDAGAYVRSTHPASGWAMVGVAVAIRTTNENVDDARVAVTGVTDRPCRLEAVESALVDVPVPTLHDRVPAIDDAVIPTSDLRGDHHASGKYRRALVSTHLQDALSGVTARLEGGSVP